MNARRCVSTFVFLVGLLTTSAGAFGHHGAAGYDMEKDTVMKATITQFEWNNPHGQVRPDAGGGVHPVRVRRGVARGMAEPEALGRSSPSYMGGIDRAL